MEEMYAALRLCTCAEKTTYLGKDDRIIVDWGRVIMGLRATLPNHIPACRSESSLKVGLVKTDVTSPTNKRTADSAELSSV